MTLVSVNLTWISLLLIPSLGKPAPFHFPPEVTPLPDWKPTISQALTDQKPEDVQYLAGHDYQYTTQQSTIKIEMRYFLNISGQVSFLLKQYSGIELSPEQKEIQQNSMGFYQTFTHDQNAYLTTCMNARGGTTILPQQFAQNRKDYDLKPDRIFLWLLGQADLRDWRCLWVLMSTPLEDYLSPEDAIQTLETGWQSWSEWWQPQFPQL